MNFVNSLVFHILTELLGTYMLVYNERANIYIYIYIATTGCESTDIYI